MGLIHYLSKLLGIKIAELEYKQGFRTAAHKISHNIFAESVFARLSDSTSIQVCDYRRDIEIERNSPFVFSK
jgi:hypothetical protein